MKNFLSPLARQLKPYVPGEQPTDKKYVKLNTNENPYPPSEKVLTAIHEAVDRLRLYPDPETMALKHCIADYWNQRLPKGATAFTHANVFVGNGSDEVLGFAFPAFFTGRDVVFADITYSFYPVYAGLFQSTYRQIPVDDAFALPVEAFAALSKDGPPPAGILLANPNAPTGRGMSKSDVEKIVSANPDTVVLVDEAYIDFGGETAIDLVCRYDNVLVVQTLSKSRSLAGLRVGYAIGHEDLIEGLSRVKNSFNSYTVDRLALEGAIAAMKDEAYFQQTRRQIMDTRERVIVDLQALGFEVVESTANFIFVTHRTHQAEALFQGLRSRGVLVRYFKKPRIDNYLRITIGTDEEMAVLLERLKELLS